MDQIFRNSQSQVRGDADSVSQSSSFETPTRNTRYLYLFLYKLHKAMKCIKKIILSKHFHIIINFFQFYSMSAIHFRFSYFRPKRERKLKSGNTSTTASKRNLKYMPTSRFGMTVCSDHGWQKKGFDSLTGRKSMLQSFLNRAIFSAGNV